MSNHSAFVGSIPQNYDQYLGPIIFEDYAQDLALRAAAPGKNHILEIAAGTGILSRKLHQVLPADGQLVVTDLNPDMLRLAQHKIGHTDNVTFCCADAAHVPFADHMFDGVVVQFGIMFFPDKVAALKEWARVLRPNGYVLLNIWDSVEHNHLIKTVTGALEAFFPAGIPRFFNVPYGWHQPDEIERTFRAAGYPSIEMTVSPRVSPCISARQVVLGYLAGTPVSREIIKQSDLELEQVYAHVEDAVRSTHGDPPQNAMMQALVVMARPSQSAHT